MPYLLYFGHVNIDVSIKVRDFGRIGESRGVDFYSSKIGGTAYNAYMGLKALGVPAEIFSVIGPEMGSLKFEGYTVKDKRSPTCWIITDGKEQMAYIYQGLWNELHRMDISVPVENYSWLHFSTGNPDFYLKIAHRARKMGKKIGFDPSQEIHYIYTPEKFIKMLSMADIFFCNEKEFERAREYAGSLLDEKVVVRTEGARGASIYLPGEGWKHADAERVKVVDTLGAGDTFRAGFYAAVYRNHDFLEALKYGNRAAARVVSSPSSYYMGTWEMLVMGKKI